MSCKEIVDSAEKQQASTKMDCPVRIFPKCHPKSRMDVFVDGKRKLITLVCGRCDRTVTTVKVR